MKFGIFFIFFVTTSHFKITLRETHLVKKYIIQDSYSYSNKLNFSNFTSVNIMSNKSSSKNGGDGISNDTDNNTLRRSNRNKSADGMALPGNKFAPLVDSPDASVHDGDDKDTGEEEKNQNISGNNISNTNHNNLGQGTQTIIQNSLNTSNVDSSAQPSVSGQGDGDPDTPNKRKAEQAGLQSDTLDPVADPDLLGLGDGVVGDGTSNDPDGMVIADGGASVPGSDHAGSPFEGDPLVQNLSAIFAVSDDTGTAVSEVHGVSGMMEVVPQAGDISMDEPAVSGMGLPTDTPSGHEEYKDSHVDPVAFTTPGRGGPTASAVHTVNPLHTGRTSDFTGNRRPQQEATNGIPIQPPTWEADQLVGAEYRLEAERMLEGMLEPLRRQVCAASDRHNSLANSFQSNFMVITGFMTINITTQIDRTSAEVDGLLAAYGLAPGMAVGLQILHTDDSGCDVLVELASSHTFGASAFYYAEFDVFVYQSHRAIVGTVFRTSNGTFRIFTLQGFRCPTFNVQNIRVLTIVRGMPQPHPSSSAYGALLLWGLNAAMSYCDDLLWESTHQYIGWASSATVGKQGSSRKEIIVKIFLIVDTEGDTGYASCRAEMPFQQAPRVLRRISMGLQLDMHDGMVSLQEGWYFAGGLGNRAATTISLLSNNMSIATILRILMSHRINRTVLVNDFLTAANEYPLVMAFVSHSQIHGHTTAYLIWRARPMEDLSVEPLRSLCPRVRASNMASLYCLETWTQQPRPLTTPVTATQPITNAWASQLNITPVHHNPHTESPSRDNSTRGGRSGGRGLRGGRTTGRTGGGNHRSHTTMPIIPVHPPVLQHARRQAQEVTTQAAVTQLHPNWPQGAAIQPQPHMTQAVLQPPLNMDMRALMRSEPIRQELRIIVEEYFAPMLQQQVTAQIEQVVGPLRVAQANQAETQNDMRAMLQELVRHARHPTAAHPPASTEPGSSGTGNV